MFICERCGSSFNSKSASTWEFCPSCQAREGVAAPLAFRPFGVMTPRPSAAQRPFHLPASESRTADGR